MQKKIRRGKRRPLIGIGCDVVAGPPPASHLSLTYSDAIERAGGVPVLLPPLSSAAAADRVLRMLDGVLFTGGNDCHPSLYRQRRHPTVQPSHPRRQEGDLLLARRALSLGTPVLGICNGLQLLNIALGGDLIQDIPQLVPGAGVHRAPREAAPARHEVRILPGSLLGTLVGRRQVAVNTYHHQAVRRLGRGLVASAVAPDGVVEAIERKGAVSLSRGRPPRQAGRGSCFLLGVQWHPERDPARFNRAIFEALIEAARASPGKPRA